MDKNALAMVDEAISGDRSSPLCKHFHDWSIEEYAALYLTDLSGFSHLASALPKMPSREIQRRYTWWEGEELMKQSVDFIKYVKSSYERLIGRPLKDAVALDYGAGWGRLTRMLLQFIPDERVHACDAWASTVDLFNELGFRLRCDLIAPVPQSLPYNADQFDLAFLFSILTHLPEESANAVLQSLHRIVKPDGLVVVTIRPFVFWRENPLAKNAGADPEKMVNEHLERGFAHLPHKSAANWGDTSISIDYFALHWPQWRILGTEDNWTHQVKILLQKN